MIIEFVGLPASGKTTIAEKMSDNLKSCNIAVNCGFFSLYRWSWWKRNLHKLLKIIHFTVRKENRSLAARFSIAILRTRQRSFVDYLRLIFNNLYLFSASDELRVSDHITILDEGSIQHIWAIASGARGELSLRKMMTYYQCPDIVIYVSVDEDIMIERNRNRVKNENMNYRLNRRHRRIVSDVARQKQIMENILTEVGETGFLQKRPIIFVVKNNSLAQLEAETERLLSVIHSIIN